jgi:hypothetical protein
VIDQLLPHSPADYVRRPAVPAESPTLGLGHLRFEALITTARLSTNRILRVRGKGGKVVLVPLPPAVARAINRAVDGRTDGPILRDTLGARMDRHAATRRLKHLAVTAGVWMPRMHPICCATPS